ncbi:MAG: tetratricopeptide repeat protein [Acidobacteriales bacterium]|nr:tetratricopeptide repeat protein [Terriglobales bacterium]
MSAGEELVPGKARKEIKRVTADLKSGHLKDARKHLSRAAVLAPSSGTVKFLQGYLAVQDNDVEGAKRYLAQAVTIAPRDLQALELLGRLQLRGNEYGAAQSTLKRATAAAPNRALAHSLLGSAYLTRKEFGQRRFPSAFVGNLRCIRKTMRFMDGDEIVQTLAPQTTDNALAVGVGNRSMGWRAPKFFSSSRSSSAERAVVRRNQSDVEKT